MSTGGGLPQKAWESLSGTLGPRRALRGKSARTIAGLDPCPGSAFFPEDPSEVSIVVKTARRENTPLVTCGSASRLKDETDLELPQAGYILLSTRNLAGVEEVQPDSLWMSVLAGTPLASAAAMAFEHGLRLAGLRRHLGTVGGWLSACTAIDDPILGISQPAVLGLEAVMATGELLRSISTPRAATGPDLYSLFLGTGGGFGVITRAKLKLEPLPEKTVSCGALFEDLQGGLEYFRALVRDFIPPREAVAVCGGSDPGTAIGIAAVYEGEHEIVDASQRFFNERAASAGAGRVDESRAHTWLGSCTTPDESKADIPLSWSELRDALTVPDAETAFSLRRPGLAGCRLRPGKGLEEKLSAAREQEQASLTSAREVMQRIREQLDPDGTCNPHAWPLKWPGGEC